MEAKLKEMLAERSKQDVAWFAPPPVEEKPDIQRRNVQNKTQ
jgi:hypothetical protein